MIERKIFMDTRLTFSDQKEQNINKSQKKIV